MPKKKDKSKGEKQNEATKTLAKDSSGEKEKNVYLNQIRYLNEQLERYQLKCDQLESQMNGLNSRCSTLEEEKKDIVEYLKRSLLDKEDEVDELTEQLESQMQAANTDRDIRQLQYSQLRQELRERIEELTSENTTLVARRAELEEFQKQKEQLMSHVESLEKKLSSQMEEHKAEIHSLEMKTLLEKKRLEKEMASQVAAMVAKAQDLVDQKVPETTRLAHKENTEVKAHFRQLSEQAQVLMVENFALRECKSQLRVDIGILEELLKETSRQSCIRKKVVEQLKVKCEQLQAELQDCRQESEQHQTGHTEVLAEVEALRKGQNSLSEQVSKNGAEVSRLEAELQEERMRFSRMEIKIQDATFIVRQALTEAHPPQSLEVDFVLQWKQLMERLLLVLNSPKPTNSTSENEQLNEVQRSDLAAARAGIPDTVYDFHLELTHYRPGDLGLVPHPKLKQKHTFSRTGAGCSSTHRPLHRKLLSQTTACSINPTGSSVRLLTSENSPKPKQQYNLKKKQCLK